ncbi:hypothetical protein MEA186_24312, partial [Mesorhizobium amorphae CCNWGS0123]
LRPSILKAGLDLAELEIPLSVEEARKRFSADLAGKGPKRWEDIWSAGHTVAAASEILSAGEVVDEVAVEYHRALGEATKLISEMQLGADTSMNFTPNVAVR